jgi:large repetitive protein
MKHFILLFFSVLTYQSLIFSQSKLDYDKDTKWFWGINGGITWQNTDVKSKTNFGYGLVLGKSFNYDYGKAVSFDFRSRFLYGNWYGQNTKTTDTTLLNSTLSSNNTNYKDSTGFYVLNFKTMLYSVDLELVLHANSLRERTGWDIYAFGGVGITSFKTKGNLLSNKDEMYAYKSLDNYDENTLNSFMDKTYESYLDGTAKGTKYYFMPSVGLGIGHQITRNISLGIEHRMTFTLLDNFDGHNDPKGFNNTLLKKENDIFHYSNAYLRFQIHHNKETIKDPKAETTNNQHIPEIVFTNPLTSGTTSSSPTFTLKADINYIQNRENINFKHNGVFNESFSYNNTTRKFESNVILQPGQNVFEIIASNPYGFDQKNTIILTKETAPAKIEFINPASSLYNTSTSSMEVRAMILNVSNQNQIEVNINGIKSSNYTFSPATGLLTFPINLNVGSNFVTINANNNLGSATENSTIVYNPILTENGPVVFFTDPTFSPYSTTEPSVEITADVYNVYAKEDLTFKHNGVVNNNFTFHQHEDRFETFVNLVPGQNVFELIANNTVGTYQMSTFVTYEQQGTFPPIISITNPSFLPFTTESDLEVLNATILNVTDASQIELLVNGQVQTDFEFDVYSNTLSAMLNLKEAQNNISLSAKNNDGIENKKIKILQQKSANVQEPSISFISPAINPFSTKNPKCKVSALVQHVDNKANVNLNVNGQDITTFSFNKTNKTLVCELNLMEGANIVTITGTNSAGTDSKTNTIILKKNEVASPPSILFIDPNDNPLTVYSPNYDVKAQVKGIKNKQNLQVTLNGNVLSDFKYLPSKEQVLINSNLLSGANIFEINATNASGTTRKATTILYVVSEPLLKPEVSITNPLINPYTSTNATVNVKATVLNIVNEQNLEVFVNDQKSENFTFNSNSKKLTLLMPLNEGNNTVKIVAKNASGTSSDVRTINFKKEQKVEAPLVSITKPNQSGTTINASAYTIKASVLNVESSSQLLVKQNGQIVNPQFYTYNPSTKELKFNTELSLGNNTFNIKATNISGNHSASTNIIYKKEEKPCDKPEVKFINPIQSGIEKDNKNFNLKFKTTNITSQNQQEILVNGKLTSGTFNLTSKITELTLTLKEGQNIIEVIARNTCGETKANTIVIFKPVNLPCTLVPGLQLIQPLEKVNITTKNNFEIKLGAINVDKKADIQVKINGEIKAFQFDNSSKLINANVPLIEGLNKILVQASNECGSTGIDIEVTKNTCVKPKISVSNSSHGPNATATTENFSWSGIISNIESNSDIEVYQNGKKINFVFNAGLKSLQVSSNLIYGVNAIEIKASNACGQDEKTYNIIRKKEVNVTPPNVQIVQPETSPFQTSNAIYNLQVTTQNVSSASQVAATVNGKAVNMNFNAQNGSLTHNLALVEGNNRIKVNVTNEYGTASDTKMIVYTAPTTISKPEITLISPSLCPAFIDAGVTQIKGSVKNVSAVNQLTIKLNDVEVTNFNPTIVDNKLNFQFEANIVANSSLKITATNTAGTENKNCMLKLNVVNTNCKPTVSATFSNDDKSATATSSKQIANIVIKYHDGSVQKMDNISGTTKTVNASGLFAGKCIVGIWVKSGCNSSTDGPDYGEFVANPNKAISCLNTSPTDGATNCKPTISANFTTDSKSISITSNKVINNVVLKYFDGSTQKISDVAAKTKTLTGTEANAGKCIVGAWIKSGCNNSNEGPGYGEYFPNKTVSSTCSNANESCLPTISALFSGNSKSVTVTSSKELKNVILKFHDGQEQKFLNQTGFNKTLKGTGVNQGKCIVGVWVKSGCNKSNEGPEYGEWTANPQNTNNCAIGNNGHGNNEDGVDDSNPGKGKGGPNDGKNGGKDDENKNKPGGNKNKPGGAGKKGGG